MAESKHHQVLIVGGGAAGITVAASLRRRAPGPLDIAIVEPSDTHYYQPCLTLVGAGAYDMARAPGWKYKSTPRRQSYLFRGW